MNLKRFFALDASRKRAIYLLKFESLLILGIVIYLLVAPLISTVSEVDALSAEIVSIVTGGSRGLGFETAKGLIAAGYFVYIIGKDENRAKECAEKLGCKYRAVDVSESYLQILTDYSKNLMKMAQGSNPTP